MRAKMPRASGCWWSFVLGVCLVLGGCQRGPQNATELYNRMPRRFSGELRVQGESTPRTLLVEVLDLNVRSEHLLEFGRVSYRVTGGDEGRLEGEAAIKGTISAPGGEIRIDEASGGGSEDALKAGSFKGKLSRDLHTIEADWKTGFGQSVHFTGLSK